jgi:superfamily II DNA or RNA helicase
MLEEYRVPDDTRLYPWQKDCLSRWFENNGRGVAAVATGAGKTRLALEAVRVLSKQSDCGELRVKIVVPKQFLARQWRADIMRTLNTPRSDIALFDGLIKENTNRPFVIYVINTARQKISRHILHVMLHGNRVLLICDECHHFTSDENSRVFDFYPQIPADAFNHYYAMGLSATPKEDTDGKAALPAIGEIIYRYNLRQASKNNITADYSVFNIRTEFLPEESDEYGDISQRILYTRIRLESMLTKAFHFGRDEGSFLQEILRLSKEKSDVGKLAQALLMLYYQRKALLHMAKMRIACAVDLARRLLPQERVIFFCERIITADHLFGELSSMFPGRIGRYHSKMSQQAKQAALEAYRHGEYAALVCCRALDEGLNVPETDAGVLLSSEGEERQRIQRIGRIVRRTDEGSSKKLYYLYIDSTVDTPILQEDFEGQQFFLHFDSEQKRLVNEEFEELAGLALDRLTQTNATPSQINTFKQQLKRGMIQPDYRNCAEQCRQRSVSAASADREYWNAMTLISAVRENEGK